MWDVSLFLLSNAGRVEVRFMVSIEVDGVVSEVSRRPSSHSVEGCTHYQRGWLMSQKEQKEARKRAFDRELTGIDNQITLQADAFAVFEYLGIVSMASPEYIRI